MFNNTKTGNCDGCNSSNIISYDLFRRDLDINLYLCKECGLVSKNSQINSNSLIVEQGDYYSSKSIGSYVNSRFIKHFTRRAKDHFRFISKFTDFDNKKSALDIGCGAGIFLSFLRDEGWIVKGIEPDPIMSQYALKELGLDIDKALFSEWESDRQYDLIYLSHVLDDLSDINSVLKKIYKNLNQGGYLFVEVPNHSWPFRINFVKKEDLEMGQYFFSTDSIHKVLENTNFNVLKIKTFHLVHLNTVFQKLISPIMLLLKLKPSRYRPYLRVIAKKI